MKISIHAEGDQIILQVSDNGPGIPIPDQAHIFDKFYRVKHPKTRHITGTGLGLSIVKGIVEAYRGSIHVESVPNQGTTFTVLIPAVQGEPGTPSS